MIRLVFVVALSLLLVSTNGFRSSIPTTTKANARSTDAGRSTILVLNESQKNKENSDNKLVGFVGNFMQDLQDMASSVDDVVDDFFNKRMGNGEVFYGKRKYKPSGSVEGDYNGMGLTDKLRIDVARARKEAFLEERERRNAERRN